jgi:protein TonB
MVRPGRKLSVLGWLGHGAGVLLGTGLLTLLFFLVLPLMQAIARPPRDELLVQSVDTAVLEPPPPPPPEPEQPEEEPEPEEPPPELQPESAPLDLSMLEAALNADFGSGWGAGDYAIKIEAMGGGRGGEDALFSLAELDQAPRAVFQPQPVQTSQTRRKSPGQVYVIFVVDSSGKVVSPSVQSSSDAVFEKPALNAVKQWRFEPGKRNGEPVRFRMRVPITFPG